MQGTFEDGLTEGLAALGLELDRQAISSLARYQRELAHWSGRMNLIAKNTSVQQMVENHFLDSLTLLPLLPEGAHLLDVGSGAGFPGLACRAVRPDLLLTMVEPRLKRVSFLRHIVRTLGLSGVRIIAGRIEDEGLLPSEMVFSHITSRAVSDIAGFLGMIERFSRPGLKVICMKGPKWREELAAAAAVIEGLPFTLAEVVERRLPGSGAVRAMLVFISAGGS